MFAAVNPTDIATDIINGLPEPALILDLDGTLVSFNKKAEESFGGLKVGTHISGAIRNPKVLDALALCSHALPHQTVVFSDRVPVERHMLATISFLGVAKSARGPSVLLFVEDLTEQHRLDELRSDFIANASHEIKTPLASLLGFIETLQGAARHDAEARDRFLTIMAQQGERMARLIDNLMSLSRIEMRAHLKPQGTVMISELVIQACDALEPMAAAGGMTVSVKAHVSHVAVQGDKDELTQVFINLIHNALKYGKPGGRVTVTIDRTIADPGSGSVIVITVEDDGPGIGRQHLPRLTERFYRVPETGVMEKGGTGLGLAIVKHVLNRHRGELEVTSQQGIGSKFTVLLTEQAPPP